MIFEYNFGQNFRKSRTRRCVVFGGNPTCYWGPTLRRETSENPRSIITSFNSLPHPTQQAILVHSKILRVELTLVSYQTEMNKSGRT